MLVKIFAQGTGGIVPSIGTGRPAWICAISWGVTLACWAGRSRAARYQKTAITRPDDGGDIENRMPAEIVDDEGDQRRRHAGAELGAALHPGIGLAAFLAGKPGGDELVGGGIGHRLAKPQDEAHRDQRPQRVRHAGRHQGGGDGERAPPDQAAGQGAARTQLAHDPARRDLERRVTDQEGAEHPAELDPGNMEVGGDIGAGDGDIAAIEVHHHGDQKDQQDQQIADFELHHEETVPIYFPAAIWRMLARLLPACAASKETSSQQNMKLAPAAYHFCISASAKVMPMLAGIWRARAADHRGHAIDDGGMLELTQHPRRTRQVGRAQTGDVDAGRVENAVDIGNAVHMLDLHHHDDGVVGLGDIGIGLSAIVRGAPGTEAARAFRRILAGRHRGARFRRRADHRNQDAVGAHVQRLLDQHRIVPGHPDHGHGGRTVEGDQAGLQAFIAEAAMLGVDQDPVESRRPP